MEKNPKEKRGKPNENPKEKRESPRKPKEKRKSPRNPKEKQEKLAENKLLYHFLYDNIVMATRKNQKSKKSKKRFRKTRSKRQRGGADECIICLGDLNDNCITTDCGHKFDRECLMSWCKTSPNDTRCPICREPISNTCMEVNPSLFWASKNGRTESWQSYWRREFLIVQRIGLSFRQVGMDM